MGDQSRWLDYWDGKYSRNVLLYYTVIVLQSKWHREGILCSGKAPPETSPMPHEETQEQKIVRLQKWLPVMPHTQHIGLRTLVRGVEDSMPMSNALGKWHLWVTHVIC